MPEVDEREIYKVLSKIKGKAEINVDNAVITISLSPIDIHEIDSPDYLLWVDISLKLYGQDLKLRIPIPIEAEKGGIHGGALNDLQKFIRRKRYPIELPMLVIAEAGYDSKEVTESFPVRISINQIPVRLLLEE
jgi:hypothetical protein